MSADPEAKQHTLGPSFPKMLANSCSLQARFFFDVVSCLRAQNNAQQNQSEAPRETLSHGGRVVSNVGQKRLSSDPSLGII